MPEGAFAVLVPTGRLFHHPFELVRAAEAGPRLTVQQAFDAPPGTAVFILNDAFLEELRRMARAASN